MLRKLRTTKKRSTRMRKRRKEKEFTCETFPLPACLTAAVRTKRRWAEFDASMSRGGLESRTPSPTPMLLVLQTKPLMLMLMSMLILMLMLMIGCLLSQKESGRRRKQE